MECTVGYNPSSNSRTASILKDVDPIPEANLLPAIVLNLTYSREVKVFFSLCTILLESCFEFIVILLEHHS